MTKKQYPYKKPLPDFPVSEKFRTKDEVEAYFDNDALVCLLCGHAYESLHKHLKNTHQCEPDEYREQFGLPWRRGLVGKQLRHKQRTIMNAQRKEGIIPQRPSTDHMRKLHASIVNRRPSTDVAKNSWHRRGLEAHGREAKWEEKDFHEFLRRIEKGRTISEVAKDEDMPTREVFGDYMHAHPEFRVKFELAWDALPFSVQVRGSRLGLRFEKELDELRGKGFSQPEIARMLGVSYPVVRGRLNGQGRRKTANIARFLKEMDGSLRMIKPRDPKTVGRRKKQEP
ncbi:MAG: hypothetical protein EOM26_01265 [Alphaproteobacteria bacterium]|nr:hypothetical protein [Alphaproteobacteria bacterium]